MCVKPFRMLNINWRGDALVCCQDYHGEVTVGNVRQATLTELWEGPVMTEYRRHLYRKDRSLPLCRYCDCHAGAYPHMVFDPFA
jgi:radical SAM protein with 4Fe4S-binding SPASM domain